MNTVENQKIIIVIKENCDKNHPYSIINMSAQEDAWLKLDGNAYKVWSYIASNQNEYQFGLSKKDICAKQNISTSTYYRAISKLKEKGFLIPKNKDSNIYYFFEKSRSDLLELDTDDILCELPQDKKDQIKEFKF